jgi:hypothetical protein
MSEPFNRQQNGPWGVFAYSPAPANGKQLPSSLYQTSLRWGLSTFGRLASRIGFEARARFYIEKAIQSTSGGYLGTDLD